MEEKYNLNDLIACILSSHQHISFETYQKPTTDGIMLWVKYSWVYMLYSDSVMFNISFVHIGDDHEQSEGFDGRDRKPTMWLEKMENSHDCTEHKIYDESHVNKLLEKHKSFADEMIEKINERYKNMHAKSVYELFEIDPNLTKPCR